MLDTHIMLFLFWTSLLCYMCHELMNMKKKCDDTYTSPPSISACSEVDAFKHKDALFGQYNLPAYSNFTPYQ